MFGDNQNATKRYAFGFLVFKVGFDEPSVKFASFICQTWCPVSKKNNFGRGRLGNDKMRSTASARADRGTGHLESQAKSKKIQPAKQHIHDADLRANKYVRLLNPWQQQIHRSITALAQPPQTPLLGN